MKALEVIAKIQSACGAKLQENHVDRIRAGNPETEVTGIVTTFMATVEVIREARRRGANLIVTHEPTYFSHFDKEEWHAGDPVVAAKRKLVDELGMVVWRFHDGMHAVKPDMINVGMALALDWEQYRADDDRWFFTLPQTTVGELAASAAGVCNSSTFRIVGDPSMKCSRVALRVGAHSPESHIRDMLKSNADVIVVGEGPEWISIAWVRDAAALGMGRAMILLGHCPSEEPAMAWCAEWIRGVVPGIPVCFVAAGEPFEKMENP